MAATQFIVTPELQAAQDARNHQLVLIARDKFKELEHSKALRKESEAKLEQRKRENAALKQKLAEIEAAKRQISELLPIRQTLRDEVSKRLAARHAPKPKPVLKPPPPRMTPPVFPRPPPPHLNMRPVFVPLPRQALRQAVLATPPAPAPVAPSTPLNSAWGRMSAKVMTPPGHSMPVQKAPVIPQECGVCFELLDEKDNLQCTHCKRVSVCMSCLKASTFRDKYIKQGKMECFHCLKAFKV